MKYVFMVHGEEGSVYRAHGSDFLSGEHIFPDFDQDDDDMWIAFQAWENAIRERANRELHELFGEEVYALVEPLYSDLFRKMSLSQLEMYAEEYF